MRIMLRLLPTNNVLSKIPASELINTLIPQKSDNFGFLHPVRSILAPKR